MKKLILNDQSSRIEEIGKRIKTMSKKLND